MLSQYLTSYAQTVYCPELPEALQPLILMYSLFSNDERRGQVLIWNAMVLSIDKVPLHSKQLSADSLV